MIEVETETEAAEAIESLPSSRHLEFMALAAVILVAAWLRLWRLDQNGFGNSYYAAAVRSMLVGWSNFFFGSFDPAGLVTVDKPPVALWFQALSARLFGYTGVSVLLPQALMGIASVVLIHHLVRRVFTAGAGLLAALIMAITPIGVAVDRNNLPEPALVLVLLLAAWALTIAAETGRLKPLLIATALVGFGFNIKMVAAFVVLPTFYLCYLAAAPLRLSVRLAHLTAATIVLALVSLSWSVAVELTPKDRRPYIGGSRNNSALDLALGYNGLGRVFGGAGNFGPPPGGFRPPGAPTPKADDAKKQALADESEEAFPPFPPVGFPPGGPGGPGGPFGGGGMPGFGGTPGILRFAGRGMAGQITWLFPLVVIGALVAAAQNRRQWPISRENLALLLWTGWFATHWVIFSFARGIFHEYYTTIMAPAVAALASIGVFALYEQWRREGFRKGWLPAAILLTAAWETYIVSSYPDMRRWLIPLLLAFTIIGTIGLLAARWLNASCAKRAAAVGFTGLLLAPAVWSLAPVLARGNPMMPAADPSVLTGRPAGMPFPPPFESEPGGNSKLVEFLRANRHGERILLAAPASMETAPIIIDTGETVVSLGGFMGGDPVLTKTEFSKMVDDGEVRFVLIGAGPGGGGPPGGPPGSPPGGFGNSEVIRWVQEHGKVVDSKLWKADFPAPKEEPKSGGGDEPLGGPPGGFQAMFERMRGMAKLYDCRPALGLAAAPAA